MKLIELWTNVVGEAELDKIPSCMTSYCISNRLATKTMVVSVVTNETLNRCERIKFEWCVLMNPLCLFDSRRLMAEIFPFPQQSVHE